MNELNQPITKAFSYLSRQGVDVPFDIWSKAIQSGVFKAGSGELASVNKIYHDAITKALIEYFEGGSVASGRNQFKRAMVQAFGDAFDLGYVHGGGVLPFTGDALEWFNARTEQELSYIDALYLQVREMRRAGDWDLVYISERADGYVNTLREIYNAARLFPVRNVYATFDGDDGAESCDSCQRLKGKRHKVSWFINRNYVPPRGSGLDCSKGGKCEHFLRSDTGMELTI